jgi:hypothetical protein
MKSIDKKAGVAGMARIKDFVVNADLVETRPGMIGLPTDRHSNTYSTVQYRMYE